MHIFGDARAERAIRRPQHAETVQPGSGPGPAMPEDPNEDLHFDGDKGGPVEVMEGRPAAGPAEEPICVTDSETGSRRANEV